MSPRVSPSPDASRPRRLGKRPGPKPTFNLRDAIDAALELGIDRFTMGAVARNLDVAPSALYRVVPDRDALIREALAFIIRQATPPNPDQPWADQLRALADRAWDVLDAHPGVATAMVTVPGAEDTAADFLDKTVAGLTAAGLARGEALFAVDFVLDTVLVTHIGYAARVGGDTAASPDAGAEGPLTPSVVFVPESAASARAGLRRKVEVIIAGVQQD